MEMKNSMGPKKRLSHNWAWWSMADEAGAGGGEWGGWRRNEGQMTGNTYHDNPCGFYSIYKGEFVKCFQAWKWFKIWVLERLCWWQKKQIAEGGRKRSQRYQLGGEYNSPGEGKWGLKWGHILSWWKCIQSNGVLKDWRVSNLCYQYITHSLLL